MAAKLSQYDKFLAKYRKAYPDMDPSKRPLEANAAWKYVPFFTSDDFC